MTGENLSGILYAMIVMSFIGGCSYTLTNANNWRSMKFCIDAEGYEWRSGDCVRIAP